MAKHGVASLILDKMDNPGKPFGGKPDAGSDTAVEDTTEPDAGEDDGGDTAAQSAFHDLSAALKSGDAAGGISALKDLLDLVDKD